MLNRMLQFLCGLLGVGHIPNTEGNECICIVCNKTLTDAEKAKYYSQYDDEY